MNAEPNANVHDAAARVLALMVAAHGCVDDGELRALDRIQAFQSLGIDRGRFVELAQACAHEIGSRLDEASWLQNGDRAYADNLLRQVSDPDERLLVCRLTAAAMAGRDCIWDGEHMLYAHMLASWHMTAPEPAVEPPR